MKIMVVDQHTLFREGVISLIKGQPDIEIVGDGKLGLDMFEQALAHKPDIVLMGAHLFEEDGKELMNVVLSEHPGTAFVVLAPNENTEMLLNVMRHGARGYLHKNISESVLLKSLYAVERGEVAISRAMMTEIARELYRMSKVTSTRESDRLSSLTFRELEVLRLLASEASNNEIGRALFISDNTVRVHVHNILEKLQTKNRREAAKFAQRLSLSASGHKANDNHGRQTRAGNGARSAAED
jgi:DNA-binding NarL/FixJ family response regulator